MVKKSIIDTASRYVKQLPTELDVRKAYLFGSCAKGLDKADSDIDIAIIVGHMPDFFATQMQLMRLRRKIDLRIEPHPIGASDFKNTNPFAYEIQQTGIEIGLK
ncbi:MAG: nucleotidyltransferase domain-containing protein [Bacteroidota bacterium]